MHIMCINECWSNYKHSRWYGVIITLHNFFFLNFNSTRVRTNCYLDIILSIGNCPEMCTMLLMLVLLCMVHVFGLLYLYSFFSKRKNKRQSIIVICPILEIESKFIIIIIYFYNYNIICHKSSTLSDQVKLLLISK